MSRPVMDELERQRGGAGGGGGGGYDGGGDSGAALLGLPQSETELDNLTEFNTAHNRRITMLGKRIKSLNLMRFKGAASLCSCSIHSV